jgi:hypothetical protein
VSTGIIKHFVSHIPGISRLQRLYQSLFLISSRSKFLYNIIGKLILLSLFIIAFMQGIDDYIPQTTMLLWYVRLKLYYGCNLWYMLHHFLRQTLLIIIIIIIIIIIKLLQITVNRQLNGYDVLFYISHRVYWIFQYKFMLNKVKYQLDETM